LIDEVKTILGASQEAIKGQFFYPSTMYGPLGDARLTRPIEPVFKSSLQFEDVEEFESHLKSRTDDIREIISYFHSRMASLSPDVTQLQDQLAKKLAEEKVTIARLEQTVAEKLQLEESLEAASLRYMVAEKKLDRARSMTVAKLEKQYMMGGQRPSSESAQSKREESSPANGGTPVGERSAELEETNNKLNAVSERQKEQLQKLEVENAKLLGQITEIKIKVCHPNYSCCLLSVALNITD
jgi:E3 ubiquitin-protein ligase BRE1